MAACEKCWADAERRAFSDPSKSKYDHYVDLITERDKAPCSTEQQKGIEQENNDER